MLTILQSLPIGAVGSTEFHHELGESWAGWQGISDDLARAALCLDYCRDILRGIYDEGDGGEEDARDPFVSDAHAAFTFEFVLLYWRAFDRKGKGRAVYFEPDDLEALSKDEHELHKGLKAMRHKRFAHPGEEAQHVCTVALFEQTGRLVPLFANDRPGAMIDDEQVDLAKSLVAKLRAVAANRLERARSELDAYLARPEIHAELAHTIRANPRHVSPEAQALKVMAELKLFGQPAPAGRPLPVVDDARTADRVGPVRDSEGD